MLDSFQKNKKGILLMLVSSVCACVGQLLWKMGSAAASSAAGSATNSAEEAGFSAILTNPHALGLTLAGFVCYGIGALVMIVAYRYGKLSILQPVLSMSYVLSIILAAVILKEQVSLLKVIGVLVIIAGVVLVATGDEKNSGSPKTNLRTQLAKELPAAKKSNGAGKDGGTDHD
jgi:drug/metabolite transporter (DMT)-like permease